MDSSGVTRGQGWTVLAHPQFPGYAANGQQLYIFEQWPWTMVDSTIWERESEQLSIVLRVW